MAGRGIFENREARFVTDAETIRILAVDDHS